MDGHVADGDVTEHRRSYRNGFLGCFGFTFHEVITGDIDSDADVFHRPVVKPDVFDHPAAPAPAFDADANLGPVAGDIVRHHVADAAGNFTAQCDRAMRAMHGTIRDGYVFRRPVNPPSVSILARFQNDAIVAGVNVTIRDPHIAAGINGNAVRVHTGIGLDNNVP